MKRQFRVLDHQTRTDACRFIMSMDPGAESFEVTVKTFKPTMTDRQRRTLWGYVYRPFARQLSIQLDTQICADDVHYACRHQFLPRKPLRLGILELSRPMSTTELKKSRDGSEPGDQVVTFGEYLEMIFKWAAEDFGIILTLPMEPPLEAYES